MTYSHIPIRHTHTYSKSVCSPTFFAYSNILVWNVFLLKMICMRKNARENLHNIIFSVLSILYMRKMWIFSYFHEIYQIRNAINLCREIAWMISKRIHDLLLKSKYQLQLMPSIKHMFVLNMFGWSLHILIS